MNSDERLEAYLQRYSKCRHISIDQAKQHALVREVQKQYKEEEEGCDANFRVCD
jgi:hypothetical protein